MPRWSTKDIPSQAGRLAIVTGATGGLGYQTALELARAGGETIVAGRNPEKGRAAVERIQAAVPAETVRFELLDLASLDSVAGFAGRFLGEGRPIDILVNNAGVMAIPERRVTADGFEMQFGTNHLGHFALTAQLLPLLRAAGSPRVVQVSSGAHRMGKINFNDLQAETSYRPWRAYSQSKLANLLLALELHRRSAANSWGIHSTAAHPGFAKTDLQTSGPGTRGWFAIVNRLGAPLVSQSAAQGALPTLYAAIAPAAVSGEYYGPSGIGEMRGAPKVASISGRARDRVAAARLWEVSEQLTGVRFDGAEAAPA